MAANQNIAVSTELGIHAGILQELIGVFTDVEPADVKATLLLEELGLDSIAAVQLANELFLQFQLQIHPDELFKLSLNVLTEHLQKPPSATSTGPNARDLTSESVSIASLAAALPTNGLATGPPILGHSFDPFEILAESNSTYETAAQRSGFAEYWSSVSPLQNDLVLCYINEAFITLGVDLSEHPCGVEISIPSCIPKYDRLMKRLLDILESGYIITQHAGKVLRGSDRIDVNTSSHLCEQLRICHPAFEYEAKLMNLIGPRLADCLSGKLDPLSVLFGNVSARQIMEDFYRGAPMMTAHKEQLVYFFVNLTKRIAASSQTLVRILEVGAGTGGTTAPLVAALENAKVPVNYTFTDIGASFIHKAKGRWGRNNWMDFVTLDIEEEMPKSFRGQYDLVIGTSVVHATRDRAATCRRLREVLRPGGVLVLSELTRPINWYDICFGLLDGWWLSGGYAIQPATVWMDAFRKAGFKGTGHSGGKSEEANTQQLLVACTED
ncbi:S-adenosyl-L-methionine-dependent methyltransferase [Xylaria arbuscula]|nr:S-adenosyl-L-methionine-dependent methyltransferase [Xylaria arbuscula]